MAGPTHDQSYSNHTIYCPLTSYLAQFYIDERIFSHKMIVSFVLVLYLLNLHLVLCRFRRHNIYIHEKREGRQMPRRISFNCSCHVMASAGILFVVFGYKALILVFWGFDISIPLKHSILNFMIKSL